MNWEPTATGYRCTRHNEEFLRAETCSHCISDPGLPPGAVQDSEALDADIMADAARYASNGKRMWREATNLLDDGTAQETNAGCKASDCAIKWERLALEAKDKVAARKHLREAMAHERTMQGRRGHN